MKNCRRGAGEREVWVPLLRLLGGWIFAVECSVQTQPVHHKTCFLIKRNQKKSWWHVRCFRGYTVHNFGALVCCVKQEISQQMICWLAERKRGLWSQKSLASVTFIYFFIFKLLHVACGKKWAFMCLVCQSESMLTPSKIEPVMFWWRGLLSNLLPGYIKARPTHSRCLCSEVMELQEPRGVYWRQQLHEKDALSARGQERENRGEATGRVKTQQTDEGER